MSQTGEVDLGLGILDHQLLDAEGRRCGKVDDLELEGVREGRPRVVAILVGVPVWQGRGFFGRVAAKVGRGRTVRVPWNEVREVGSAVHLRSLAGELRLARGDDRARAFVERLPKAR